MVQQALVLACPYLDPWRGLTAAIERAHARGVAIHLILRGAEEREKHAAAAVRCDSKFTALHRAPACQGLPGEQAAVLSSMNLLASSALDSVEFAVTVLKQLHPDGYQQALKVCRSPHRDGRTGSAAAFDEDAARKRSPGGTLLCAATEKYIPACSAGHCIRCGDEIPAPTSRLCPDCYKTWSKYSDETMWRNAVTTALTKARDLHAQTTLPELL